MLKVSVPVPNNNNNNENEREGHMNRLTRSAAGVAIVLGGMVAASAVTLDFDGLTDGANIHGVNLGGVTFTAPGGVVEVYKDRFGVGYKSAFIAIANLNPAPAQDNPLIGTFDAPVDYVSLWGGDQGGDEENWTLEAWGPGGLLASGNSGTWNGAPYRQIALSAPGITYIKAIHGGSSFGVGFDDLEFRWGNQVADTGSTLALLGLALVGCRFVVARRG